MSLQELPQRKAFVAFRANVLLFILILRIVACFPMLLKRILIGKLGIAIIARDLSSISSIIGDLSCKLKNCMKIREIVVV